jgi:hypothetical protein
MQPRVAFLVAALICAWFARQDTQTWTAFLLVAAGLCVAEWLASEVPSSEATAGSAALHEQDANVGVVGSPPATPPVSSPAEERHVSNPDDTERVRRLQELHATLEKDLQDSLEGFVALKTRLQKLQDTLETDGVGDTVAVAEGRTQPTDYLRPFLTTSIPSYWRRMALRLRQSSVRLGQVVIVVPGARAKFATDDAILREFYPSLEHVTRLQTASQYLSYEETDWIREDFGSHDMGLYQRTQAYAQWWKPSTHQVEGSSANTHSYT